jgi:hypothetical protein
VNQLFSLEKGAIYRGGKWERKSNHDFLLGKRAGSKLCRLVGEMRAVITAYVHARPKRRDLADLSLLWNVLA